MLTRPSSRQSQTEFDLWFPRTWVWPARFATTRAVPGKSLVRLHLEKGAPEQGALAPGGSPPVRRQRAREPYKLRREQRSDARQGFSPSQRARPASSPGRRPYAPQPPPRGPETYPAAPASIAADLHASRTDLGTGRAARSLRHSERRWKRGLKQVSQTEVTPTALFRSGAIFVEVMRPEVTETVPFR